MLNDPYGAGFAYFYAPPTTISTGLGEVQTAVVQAGINYVQNFNAAQDQLDLTKLLAGDSLAHDLSNIGNFIQVVGPGAYGFSPGTTTLDIAGMGGSAIVNLEGSGALTLQDLLKNNSLILPPH